MKLVEIARHLSQAVADLEFVPPTAYVYNPLEYARKSHEAYLRRYGRRPKQVLLLGMNPGPWGMAQTGVPFGEIDAVRDWLGIEAQVGKPAQEHPKRPVEGFKCRRSEVSGRRLWGWARQHFHTPERFFERFFVYNYCPLLFLEAGGRNRTPDHLAADERRPLLKHCDQALHRTVAYLKPSHVVGVGSFAEDRARRVLAGESGITVGRILHPSPASPAANRGWTEQATRELAQLGIEVECGDVAGEKSAGSRRARRS